MAKCPVFQNLQPGVCVTGHYVGDGADKRTISVGFRPSFVWIHGLPVVSSAPALIMAFKTPEVAITFQLESRYTSMSYHQDTEYLLTDDGFQIGKRDNAAVNASNSNARNSTNAPDITYYYTAFR